MIVKALKENFDIVKDVAIVLFIIASMYLSSHYVTNEKFTEYEKANELAHQGISTTLINVDKTLALMEQNQTLLIQNQKQIGINTIKIAEMEIRLKAAEVSIVDLHNK